MPDDPPSAQTRLDPAASAEDLLREAQVLRGVLDRQIDRLDRIEKHLRGIIAFLRGSPRAWQLLPEPLGPPVAYSLITRRLPDDSVEIRVDGYKPLVLAPQLAELVRFLTSNGDKKDGEAEGWRSREDIAAWLGVVTGNKVRRQYVNNLVSRLRGKFKRAGLPPGLIQTHRTKGVRFSMKRSVPAGDGR